MADALHKTPKQILTAYLPEKSVPYCLDLLTRYPFKLKLKKSRVTKAGDFCAHHGTSPTITINHDLNPYLFLTTFIHEFSHHAVHLIYGNKPKAHGDEWKLAFKTFMQPIMEMEIFPPDLQHALEIHLKDPMASSYSDSHLTQIFRRYSGEAPPVILQHIQEGMHFKLRGKLFKKGKLRRTRVLCLELKSGREYLVPVDAEISEVVEA
jgi:hypothetical protein